MNHLHKAVSLVMTFALAATVEAENAPARVTVTVDTSKPRPEINPNIYGQFIEHQGRVIYDGIWVGERTSIPNIRGYRKDVVEALKRIHVPILRWPGGCFADQYDWRDGIGPRSKRPSRLDMYGGPPESNAFGTHEFLDFAELIGADAYIAGNMGSMTPRDMAQWLEYMTSSKESALVEERHRNGREKPWLVKYFGLGNEVWGCGGDMRGDYATDLTRRYSMFLNVSPSQTLVKVASGPSADGDLPDYAAYLETMMRNSKDVFGAFPFEALSLHHYTGSPLMHGKPTALSPATGFSEDKWADFLRSAAEMEPQISAFSKIMDRYDPDRKVALFVDEWGAWHQQERGAYQQNTLLDAEVAALSFNVFHRHTDRVKMASNSMTVNAFQALILTEKQHMLLTPTYHVFDMYQPFRGAVPYPVSVSGATYEYGDQIMPAVDVSAARGKDGRLYLALVNLDPHRPADVITNLVGRANGRILTARAMDSHNTFEASDTVHPAVFSGSNTSGTVVFNLPAKSVAVVAIE